jgi:hypothetical protein
MGRYRRIRTGVRSERELARALDEMGLKDVEVHADAQPLADWIGRPTDVLANVIVRRKSLGAASDDLGFVRSTDGTFDLILSDIHLFKFDRKWIDELARRTGTVSVTSTPQLVASTTAAKHVPPPPPRAQNVEQRARIEAAELLDKARRGQSMGRLGCPVFFLPILPWILLEQIEPVATGIRGLMVLMLVWSVVWFIGLAIVITARLGRVVREFQSRFPTRAERAAALAHLREIAADKQNASAEAAKKLMAAIEQRAATALTQRPESSDRATGGKAR